MGDQVYNFVGEIGHMYETRSRSNYDLKPIILVAFLRAIESTQGPLQSNN